MRVRDEWKWVEGVIADMWHVLRAVTLHVIWPDRNRCLFDGRHPIPTLTELEVVLKTFAVHIRYFQRRQYISY